MQNRILVANQFEFGFVVTTCIVSHLKKSYCGFMVSLGNPQLTSDKSLYTTANQNI